MFICNSCEEVFETPYVADRGLGVFVNLCPKCFSWGIEEVEQCPICRTYYYPHEKRGGVCKGCFQDAVDSYKSCIGYLMPWEREVLEDEYGTIDITERED